MSSYISFSQISKYTQCARSYKLHYVDKLREKSITAFLPFGNAMDEALNLILNDLKENKSVTMDYKAAFDSKWHEVEINKKKYSMAKCIYVGYNKADYVSELLTQEDKDLIQIVLPNEYKNKDLDTVVSILEDKKSNRRTIEFLKEEHESLNYINWLSLRRKGHVMLDAYIANIVPEIAEVIDIQKKIELSSNVGTRLLGFIDAIVRFKDDTELTVLDNKTSGSEYELSRVYYSQQLALYCYEQGLKQGAYAVLLKNIKLNKEKTCSVCGHSGTGKRFKTCDKETVDGERCGSEWNEVVKPEAMTQLIKGVISQDIQEMVVETASDILDAINLKVYPRNLNACKSMFGQPCIFIKKCWGNNDEGLEKLD